MEIINCKLLSENLKEFYKNQIDDLKDRFNKTPTLLVILVGEDKASQTYVRNKEKACELIGIESKTLRLPNTISESDLLEIIEKANNDININGILVQLPLPQQIDKDLICNSISKEKDVDGFIYNSEFQPCTPLGIIHILNNLKFKYKGKKAVVLGRSNIVGMPIAKMLLDRNCTVTICHSYSNLSEACLNADLIISAIGKPKFLNDNIINAPNSIIIDVGINRDENNKLCGDVDIKNITCNAITPVPGGVGPMTITMLLYNVIKAFVIQNK